MFAALRQRLNARFVAWALRSRPPEPVPIRLTQRRVYVLPTRAGLMYVVALVVMLIGAINYSLSLGHALVFLLAGLGVAAILHTFRNLAGLSITCGTAAPVFAGEMARFPLMLANKTPRPRRLIRGFLPGETVASCHIDGTTTASLALECPAPRRGWLSMPRATLETVWPLGLVRAWSYIAPEFFCLVYPRPAQSVPSASTFDQLHGGRLTSDTGDEDFAGLRRHQPSDAPHHVAWKSAARQGADAPLQTKQFSGSAAPSLMFDWATLPPQLGVEDKLAILARWVLDAEAAGLSWGMRLPGSTLPLAHGPAHLHESLKRLALYEG